MAVDFLGTMIVFMILPFKVFFYESRTWLLKRIWIVFTAPFHYVTFADFWLADQLNSLVLALRDIQFLVCFYIMEVDWLQNPEPGSCTKHTRTYGIRSIIAVFPAWIRFAQCLRRYRDTRKSFPHLVNAGKYATSFFVVLFSTLDAVDKELSGDNPTPMAQRPMFYLWVLSAVIGSCYGFAWDVKMDWGFFDLKAAPSAPLLREDMVYNSRWFYYFAIVEDFILRYAWVLSITVAEFESHFHEYLLVFMGLFELFRRFIWNFFRLENEHLNNCGQFRAVRDISIAPIKKNDLQLIEEMMDTDNGVFHRTLMYPVSAAKKYRAISKPELMEGISNEQIATTYLSEEVRTKLGVPEGPYKPPVFKRPVFGLPDPNSTLLEEEEDEDSNLLKKDE